ncbi:hypothetical protein F5Y02DRAFT_113540 [Annulohypoxylon stygium]|nr:hypothetical protein F5Y02DRAFT_113540 [Annulohypoxylon stygium]
MTDISTPQDGRSLSSYDRSSCSHCGLDYLNTGGKPKPHPSHAGANGQRCFIATIRPFKYAHSGDTYKCLADFIFSGPSSSVHNTIFECPSIADSSPAAWNLDNTDIATMVQFMHYVEDVLIPHRKSIVEEYLYTNSEYFAGQAWRFDLGVQTGINREVYDFLLEAHRLDYSSRHKAFVKRNASNVVTKIYPVTEERRYQTVSFLEMVQRLASLGIRVYWQVPHTREETTAARERCLGITSPTLASQSVGHIWEPELDTQARIEEWIQEVYVDPSEGLPSHEGYEAIQHESPNLGNSRIPRSLPRALPIL